MRRAGVVMLVVAFVAACALFVRALVAMPVPMDVGVVVVADPSTPMGARMPVRVIGVQGASLPAFAGTVDGAPVERGLVHVSRAASADAALHVVGSVNGSEIDERFVLRRAVVDAGVSIAPWTTSVAGTHEGASTVYPLDATVASGLPADVLLVDARGALTREHVEGAVADARLRDGRSLRLQRGAVVVRLDGLDAAPGAMLEATLTSATARRVTWRLLVAGIAVEEGDVDLGAREGRVVRMHVPQDARVGDLVVVHASEPPPSHFGASSACTFVGGPRAGRGLLAQVDGSLVRLLDDDASRDVVARALLARLRPNVVDVAPLPPDVHEQIAARTDAARARAASLRADWRVAAGALLVVVLAVVSSSHLSRRRDRGDDDADADADLRRPPSKAVAIVAVLAIVVLLLGLDAALGFIVAGASLRESAPPVAPSAGAHD